MDGSRTIRVIKRDQSIELFDVCKLAGSIWRAMQGGARYDHSRRLAEAVELYLTRRSYKCISSSAIFEMVVKALRHVGLDAAADSAEAYDDWRNTLRKQLRIRYNTGKLTFWDKGWLCEFARRSWHLRPVTARWLAGLVEIELFAEDDLVVSRQNVIERLNRCVSQYGLADAVPVRQ